MKPDLKGLTKLADHLVSVPRKQFDMVEWWYDNECGSTGCILGHAATLFPHRFRKIRDDGNKSKYYIQDKKTGGQSEYAFANSFRIPLEEANGLVYHTEVRTPKQAARAVRALVERLQKVEQD